MKADVTHVIYNIAANEPRTGVSKEQFQHEKGQLKEDCAICCVQPPVENEPLKTECGHIYCAKCLIHWILQKKSCPGCLQEAWLEDLVLLDVVG